MIDKYQFGSITINGKVYYQDIEIKWNGEVLPWARKESHIFSIEDIQRAINQNPTAIIFGTGAYGAARVTPETIKLIKEQGIRVEIDKTAAAVEKFNNYQKTGEKVIGLFHLTC